MANLESGTAPNGDQKTDLARASSHRLSWVAIVAAGLLFTGCQSTSVPSPIPTSAAVTVASESPTPVAPTPSTPPSVKATVSADQVALGTEWELAVDGLHSTDETAVYVPGTGAINVESSRLLPGRNIARARWSVGGKDGRVCVVGSFVEWAPAQGTKPGSDTVYVATISLDTQQIETEFQLRGASGSAEADVASNCNGTAIVSFENTDGYMVVRLYDTRTGKPASAAVVNRADCCWYPLDPAVVELGDAGRHVVINNDFKTLLNAVDGNPATAAMSDSSAYPSVVGVRRVEGAPTWINARTGERLRPSTDFDPDRDLVDPVRMIAVTEDDSGILFHDLRTGRKIRRLPASLGFTPHAILDGVAFGYTSDEPIALDLGTGDSTVLSDMTYPIEYRYGWVLWSDGYLQNGLVNLKDRVQELSA